MPLNPSVISIKTNVFHRIIGIMLRSFHKFKTHHNVYYVSKLLIKQHNSRDCLNKILYIDISYIKLLKSSSNDKRLLVVNSNFQTV